MLSFKGNEELKEKYVAHINIQYENKHSNLNDQYRIIWLLENAFDHPDVLERLGICPILSKILDCIFIILPNNKVSEFSKLINIMPVGKDLSMISWFFLQWVVSNLLIKDAISVRLHIILFNLLHGHEVNRNDIIEVSDLIETDSLGVKFATIFEEEYDYKQRIGRLRGISKSIDFFLNPSFYPKDREPNIGSIAHSIYEISSSTDHDNAEKMADKMISLIKDNI